jgi:carbonic anhydrase
MKRIMNTLKLGPDVVLEQLLEADERYRVAEQNEADISATLREKLFREGQHPRAVVVACSDSRVIPEDIFLAGPGELFVVRTAGNVVGDVERASIEYAVLHLGVRLVVVMGHSGCGAVGAAMKHGHEMARDLSGLVEMIAGHIGGADDETVAVNRNIAAGVDDIMKDESLSQLIRARQVKVVGLRYDTLSGGVEVLE